MIRLVGINQYGMVMTEVEKTIPPVFRDYYCWNGEAKIHMYDGTLKNAQDVCIGDVLLGGSGGPTTVRRVKETIINNMHKMVRLSDFWITRGHPVFMNGEWYRPDEMFPLAEVYIDTLYNFFAEPEHFLVVGEDQITCSSLGGYCPRLAAIDPFSDILYGRGYGSIQAENYRWLLSLKERIPDSQVVPKEPSRYEDLFPGREELVVALS